MKSKRLSRLGLGIAIFCLTMASAPSVFAEGTPPVENKGVTAKVIGSMPLAGEINSVDGRQLRMRMVTLAPGGHFAVHNHKDRPTLEFVLKGTVKEFRGNESKEFHEGESVVADKDTTHWWLNVGSEPAVFLTADVFNPPK